MSIPLINPKYTSAEAQKELRSKFDNAIPCRHLVLDDFLDQELADKLFEKFPSSDKS